VDSEADRLLYVMTAKRELGWSASKKVLDELYRTSRSFRRDVSFSRSRILRLMDAFGFCDFSFTEGQGRIFVCPVAFVRLPLKQCSALLVGARGPTTFTEISNAVKDSTNLSLHLDHPQGDGFLPVRMTVESADLETLARFSRSLQISFEPEPACWRVAMASGNIESYERSLKWSEGPDLNWKSWTFDPEYVEFRKQVKSEVAVRLVRYLDPVKNVPRYRLWKGKLYADIDVDWGRYIVLRDSGFNVLYYDPFRYCFAVPRNASLPRLLQRALGLSSGLAPMPYGLGSRQKWDLFQMVPAQVADIICKKVAQDLSTFNLKLTGDHL
jgi:hypothetical protein